MDTRTQNAWKELVDKEASTRIQAKLRTEETKDEDEWFVRSKYTQNKPSTSGKLITSINYPPKPVRHDPAQMAEELTKKIKESNINLLSDMKPVDTKTKDLLFDGISKEEKGRYQYLKARKSETPENKYDYPILSSFEYGWKLNELNTPFKSQRHGRSKIVEESFYRRNGIF